jgi:methylmalonyl-CoA mutase cobalamin-binding subunit
VTEVLLRDREPRKIVLSTVSSDAHTWNLVFLQLVLEEMGHNVINLGACVPDENVIEACLRHQPDAVVISTVNGHGYADGKRLIGKLRAQLAEVPVVIGGKLGVSGADDDYAQELVDLGYSAVFSENQSVEEFRFYIEAVGLEASLR